ncbi:hypothetical protein ACP6PL_25530 [Dapis sp. BLCC M126]
MGKSGDGECGEVGRWGGGEMRRWSDSILVSYNTSGQDARTTRT